jgi:hypothetical protein
MHFLPHVHPHPHTHTHTQVRTHAVRAGMWTTILVHLQRWEWPLWAFVCTLMRVGWLSSIVLFVAQHSFRSVARTLAFGKTAILHSLRSPNSSGMYVVRLVSCSIPVLACALSCVCVRQSIADGVCDENGVTDVKSPSRSL